MLAALLCLLPQGYIDALGQPMFKSGFETRAPIILSSPPTTATVGALYVYNVDAIDLDNDPLTYMLTVNPAGMSIDPVSGLIEWTPAMVGDFPVTVSVDDANQGTTEQSWMITVMEGGVDTDGDGLTDDFEDAIGTDPNDPDTDDDALDDGEEVFTYGSDPLDPDTDRDGLYDGDEVNIYATDPTNVDTDGDHFGDGLEITVGTNPLDPADFPAGPPDPQALAPENDPTVTTALYDSIEFLFEASPPVQSGVAPGAIEPVRAAVLRGQALTREGEPLPGVTVFVEGEPDLGMTESRVDGRWDLAVNGGGALTLHFNLAGFLPAQRTLNVPWQQFVELEDVVLIPLDSQSTPIDLTMGVAQLAQASPSTDADGTRQAALIFPAGTTAELELEGGGTMPATNLTIRATEYTVGENGPATMPNNLPPSSGYTYAVELSADEAMAPGIDGLNFSQPVFSYTENFLGFPVGTAVPAGYYDFEQAAWVPSPDGIVIKILGVTGGLADVDVDGDDIADTGMALTDLGFTDAEREHLAATYTPPQELWRVPVEHFTPWDYNWPYGPPPDAVPPLVGPPRRQSPVIENGMCKVSKASIIEIQDQVLREEIPVSGTPFFLVYSSNDVPGRITARTVDIPLSGPSIPASLARIDLELSIAGQNIRQSFAPAADQETTFTWNGRDAYGREVFGRQLLKGSVNFVYDAVYFEPGAFEAAFAQFGGTRLEAVQSRREIVFPAPFSVALGNYDARNFGLGGWRLNVHHAFDPIGRVLVTGDGLTRGATDIKENTVSTIAGDNTTEEGGYSGDGGPAATALLDGPEGVEVLSDGSVLIADTQNHRIRKVGPDGIITTFAGTGLEETSGDGGPATQAGIEDPVELAVGPDGSVYVSQRQRIRRITPDGIINTIAGNGTGPSSGDGGPAIDAQVSFVIGLDVASDGTVYFVELLEPRLRRIDPSGIIQTIAGDGTFMHSGDGGPAQDATLDGANDVAIAPDGSLFLAEDHRVRRIGTDGVINTIAGNGNDDYTGDGGPAPAASFGIVRSVAFGQDALYIADDRHDVVRKVTLDGIITTYAGTTDQHPSGDDAFGDGGPPVAAGFYSVEDLALDAQDTLLIADDSASDIRRVQRTMPGFSSGDIGIASLDGTEFYQFNANGKHLRTFNSLTGAVLYEFAYDPDGRLESITDGDGKVTTIQRDGSGNPVSITGHYGHVTSLTTDVNGYLNGITNPQSETFDLLSTPGGLIAETTDAGGRISSYEYDALGRLVSQSDNAGSSQSLVTTPTPTGSITTRTTAMGRQYDYGVAVQPLGMISLARTFPDGTMRQSDEFVGAGTVSITRPGGVTAQIAEGADPRFGMQSPIAQSVEITYPTAGTAELEFSVEANLEISSDPLSLQTLTETHTLEGQAHVFDYDAATRTATSTSSEGRTSVISADELGRPLSAQLGDLEPYQLSYDAQGRLTQLNQGSGGALRSHSFAYEPNGFLDTITDPDGRVASFDYDSAGRLTQHTVGDGTTISYGYDANGNRTSLTPPGQPAHIFVYDIRNRLTEIIPPAVAGTGSELYEYNADDELIKITRGNGETLDMTYEANGRLSARTQNDGTPDIVTDTLSYDPEGRIEQIASTYGVTLNLTYDGDLVTGETFSGAVTGAVTRQYNNLLSLVSQTIAGQPITFTYDNDGQLDTAGPLDITRYPTTGLVSGTTLGTVVQTRTQNEFGENIGEEYVENLNTLYTFDLTRDKRGRISQKIETIGGVTDTYDYDYSLTGRLTSVMKNGMAIESYDYDDNGNRTSATVGGAMVTATYDAQDRLEQYDSTTYSYDGAGDLISKDDGGQVTTFDYDALGNLLNVTLPDATSIEYVPDPLGRRVIKTVNGVFDRAFLYDGEMSTLPVAEIDAGGMVVSRFVYGTGQTPAYMIRDGIEYRLITDPIGSVRLVVDAATGAIAQRLDYDTFGNVTMDTNPGFQSFGFAGGLYDPDTGLVRFGRRDYDPQIGRWLTKDPSRFGGGTNLYVYSQNDPVNYRDRTGQASEAEVLAAYNDEIADELARINPLDDDATPSRQRQIDPETGQAAESRREFRERRQRRERALERRTIRRMQEAGRELADGMCGVARGARRALRGGLPGFLNVLTYWDVLKRAWDGPRKGQSDWDFIWDLTEVYLGYPLPPEIRGCDPSRQSCIPMA